MKNLQIWVVLSFKCSSSMIRCVAFALPDSVDRSKGGVKMKATTKRRQKRRDPAVQREARASLAADSSPVVGIGASAGGLEALKQFIGHVPSGAGMAFVAVQHLDPAHKGLMPELLQRVTGMKVVQVKGRTRSLAQDWEERNVGVILSGMGTDGTLGLRAVKEKAGVALERELQRVCDEVRATHEEMQTSQEDLRSANAELQAKVDDFAPSSDMKNLIDSTDIATKMRERSCEHRPPQRNRSARVTTAGSRCASCLTAQWTTGLTAW